MRRAPMARAPGSRIALVDDEAASARRSASRSGARAIRRSRAYRRRRARAWEAFQRRLPDLAVLDILMPRMDGLELCRRLRGRERALPIIFLTSQDEEFDRVLGLELGADDYLCKPFSMRELLARVKVLFRRVRARREPSAAGRQTCSRSARCTLDLDRYRGALEGHAGRRSPSPSSASCTRSRATPAT